MTPPHANLAAALTAHHRPAGDLVELADEIAAAWRPIDRPATAARAHDLALIELARRAHLPAARNYPPFRD
jgi:hypothetical protein